MPPYVHSSCKCLSDLLVVDVMGSVNGCQDMTSSSRLNLLTASDSKLSLDTEGETVHNCHDQNHVHDPLC